MTETNQLLDELKQSKKLFREGDPDEKSTNEPKTTKDDSFKKKLSAYMHGYGDSKLLSRKSPRNKSKNFSFAYI